MFCVLTGDWNVGLESPVDYFGYVDPTKQKPKSREIIESTMADNPPFNPF